MRVLTGQTALDAWERGQRFDLVGRALALLSAAAPEVPRQRLAELPLGQRDALLMRLRERTFGAQQRGFARCLNCGAPLEFTLDLRAFQPEEQLQAPKPATTWHTSGEYQVCFRLPNSSDMQVIAEYSLDVESAREMLLERCVVEARRHGQPIAARQLPDEVVEQVGVHMEELDPLGDLPLVIDCGRCGYTLEVVLDLANLLWQEVEGAAKRLLHEVHTLASAYGWTEREILTLSAARRRSYISQVRPARKREA